MISARVVQALGGAALLATSLAVVLSEFPVNKRSTAIGIWGAAGSLGGAFGPSFGALLINLWNWRLVFFINAPLCVLVLSPSPLIATVVSASYVVAAVLVVASFPSGSSTDRT